MLEFVKMWLELKVDRRAVTALEYGLIAALIAVAIISGVTALGSNINKTFTTIAWENLARHSVTAISIRGVKQLDVGGSVRACD